MRGEGFRSLGPSVESSEDKIPYHSALIRDIFQDCLCCVGDYLEIPRAEQTPGESPSLIAG